MIKKQNLLILILEKKLFRFYVNVILLIHIHYFYNLSCNACKHEIYFFGKGFNSFFSNPSYKYDNNYLFLLLIYMFQLIYQNMLGF